MPPIALHIDAMTHEGRGVGAYLDGDLAGKKVFVDFALAGETASVKLTETHKRYDAGTAIAITDPSDKRTQPFCAHFGVCGGCSLQHMDANAQIAFKGSVLAELLAREGVSAEHWLAPIVGARTHYRTKARLGVRYLANKDEMLLGFREKNSNFLAKIDHCPILDARFGAHFGAVKTLLHGLDARAHIAQLELAMGDDTPTDDGQVAVIVRHLVDLGDDDLNKLKAFFAERGWQLYLQRGGADTVMRVPTHKTNHAGHMDASSLAVPPKGGLHYRTHGVDFAFSPQDFTQVNFSVNTQMLSRALELLDLKQGERVLDLFCGLGNFSLVMAKMGCTVIGVEGSGTMTERAAMNAKKNGLDASFFAQDLNIDFSHLPLFDEPFDAVLIDPPRSGAPLVMDYIAKFGAQRVVYVSCNPITLARDAAKLCAAGYKMTHAGVMDMFCHTAHVESIARFEKIESI